MCNDDNDVQEEVKVTGIENFEDDAIFDLEHLDYV